MGDITLRAIEILRRADIIACEDTRVTGRLLKAHGVTTPMTQYHEHNASRARPALIARLEKGGSIALVSDAGTPLISDPGYRLVKEAVEAGIAVTTAPGASATLSALVVSGLPSDRFLFAGFPPTRAAARRESLAELSGVPATLIFLESTKRLAATLKDMTEILGRRDAAVARELTKLHEEVRRGDLAELAAYYADSAPPKGEAVIVVGPPGAAAGLSAAEIEARLAEALATMTIRDAAAAVAAETGQPRRRLYARALEIAAKKQADDAG